MIVDIELNFLVTKLLLLYIVTNFLFLFFFAMLMMAVITFPNYNMSEGGHIVIP